MKNILYTLFLPCLVFFLILSVRISGLNRSPISVNYDEAALGYNSFSLLHTLRDEYGYFLPIALRSFNDYKPALYSYLTIPFVAILGLNMVSTRLVSAIFGTASLFFLYLIIRHLTKFSSKHALLTILFISFLPWRLHYSRVAFEANLAMSFFTMGVWAYLNFHKNKFYKIFFIAISALAIYSYHSARVAIPVFLFLNFINPLEKLKHFPSKIISLWPLLLIVLLSLPIFLLNNSRSVFQRFNQTNIFSTYYPYTPSELINQEAPVLTPYSHPLYYFGGILIGRVLSYLNPKNLALETYHWVTNSAQNMPGVGMLGWFGAILFIFGLNYAFSHPLQQKNSSFYIYWYLSAVTPAAITLEWFHPLRSLNVYPLFDLLIAFGVIKLMEFLNSQKFIIRSSLGFFIIILAILTSHFQFQNELNFTIYATNGEYQPGGFKEGAPLLKELSDHYSTIYIDSPHAQNYIFFVYFLSYPPQYIQPYAASRPSLGFEGSKNFNFDKFVYQKFDWPKYQHQKDFIFWTSSEVKEEEIARTPGAKLYKIYNSLGLWTTSIITKE